MPLDYIDFAHHYEGQLLTDDQKRVHFDTLADLLDSIARLFWRDRLEFNKLGITLREDLKLSSGSVASKLLTHSFNDAAPDHDAGKQEP